MEETCSWPWEYVRFTRLYEYAQADISVEKFGNIKAISLINKKETLIGCGGSIPGELAAAYRGFCDEGARESGGGSDERAELGVVQGVL